MQTLISKAQAVLADTRYFLERISAEDYRRPLAIFTGSSIGQHTRHLLEFFQCLFEQGVMDTACVNYDLRRRDLPLEQDRQAALSLTNRLVDDLSTLRYDRQLSIESAYGGALRSTTSLTRELLHTIEHAVHHLALIRIGLMTVAPGLPLPDHFGVAASTLVYRSPQAVTEHADGAPSPAHARE